MNLKKILDRYNGSQTYKFFRITDDDNAIDNEKNLNNPALVNDVFNACLQQQIDGTLPQGFVYELGMPSKELLSSGIKDLPIEMASRRLLAKSMQENHLFDLKEIFNLPNAIQNPLAVFRSATKMYDSYVVLTELKHKGKNFVAAIQVNERGNNIEVNSIRSVHYRTLYNIVDWITEGLGEYFSKDFEKVWLNPTKKELLSKQQYQPVDVRKQLNNATKIVENFNNPNKQQEK